jgi:hypothetical protein
VLLAIFFLLFEVSMFGLSWAMLWGFIAAAIVPFLRIALRSLGIGGVTYVGLSVLFTIFILRI